MTSEVWGKLLSDVDDNFGKAAVIQLCGSCEFPPTISQIREIALDLSGGRVTPPSPWEAWENVHAGKELSEIERRALNAIGGSYSLKRSENIGVDRSNFVKAYTDFLNTDRKMSLAIPEVRQLAEHNRQDIAQVDRQIGDDEEIVPPTQEELAELLKGVRERVEL